MRPGLRLARVQREQLVEEGLADLRKQGGGERIVVSADDIAQVVAGWTGIPVRKLAEEESERLLKLEEVLQ